VRAILRQAGYRMYAVLRETADTAAAARQLTQAMAEAAAALPPDVRAQAGLTDAAIAAMVRSVNTPWFRYFLRYDPRPTLRRVRVPVLAVNGALDLQVPAEANLSAIGQALREGGNRDHEEVLLPGLNHLFQTATTGGPAEYGRIQETMSPVMLERVSEWILARTRPKVRKD
jgi:fermentation-respiration switch protein FrsA (DUF1100 family)